MVYINKKNQRVIQLLIPTKGEENEKILKWIDSQNNKRLSIRFLINQAINFYGQDQDIFTSLAKNKFLSAVSLGNSGKDDKNNKHDNKDNDSKLDKDHHSHHSNNHEKFNNHEKDDVFPDMFSGNDTSLDIKNSKNGSTKNWRDDIL